MQWQVNANAFTIFMVGWVVGWVAGWLGNWRVMINSAKKSKSKVKLEFSLAKFSPESVLVQDSAIPRVARH